MKHASASRAWKVVSKTRGCRRSTKPTMHAPQICLPSTSFPKSSGHGSTQGKRGRVLPVEKEKITPHTQNRGGNTEIKPRAALFVKIVNRRNQQSSCDASCANKTKITQGTKNPAGTTERRSRSLAFGTASTGAVENGEIQISKFLPSSKIASLFADVRE